MIYLFLGEDDTANARKIAQIKKEILTSQDALKFDYDLFYGKKLSSDELKKSIIALPVVSPQRLVVIHMIHKLSPRNKELILEFAKKGLGQTVLILETTESGSKNSFLNKLIPHCKVSSSQSAAKKNVFDMTKAISAHQPVNALKILSELFSRGEPPLQILGALVWFWGKKRDRLPSPEFKKGLLALQEADLNIKRSRLNAEHAVELVVVKLMNIKNLR